MTSGEDRKILLAVARAAINSGLKTPQKSSESLLPPGAPRPEGSGGAFVTLKSRGRLRGCIGMLQSDKNVDETVAEMARAAAFSDPRFPPVSPDEVDLLSVEISRLSEFSPIRADDVVVGTHGLLIRLGRRSGLLLPQVPGEQGWNRREYLSGLCRKAGLPDGSWNHPDAELQGFTAEVFGEEEPE